MLLQSCFFRFYHSSNRFDIIAATNVHITILWLIAPVVCHIVVSGADECTALIFSTGESSPQQFSFPVLRK